MTLDGIVVILIWWCVGLSIFIAWKMWLKDGGE